MANNNIPAKTAWAGYAFAAIATGALVVFRFELDQLIGSRISVPLCGLAAVFVCIWKAGTGPALFASALTTAWYVWDSHASGTDAWIHYAIYAAEAGVFCFYGRQLRVAKDRAAQGEDWQQHLVQTAGEGIWTVDPDGAIGYANPRIAEILGCDTHQITGRKVEEFLFPEDYAAERIRFQNRRAGVKEQYDRRLRRADGSEVWTLACSSPYSSGGKDAGLLTGLLTMMTDITERKKAEHALRRSERKFRELFENIREGVYQTSPDGRILAANPELLRMLGFSNQEELNVVGVVRDTFVDAALHQNLRDTLERDGSYANIEFQLRTRDLRIITVRENARVVRDENGDVLYYEGTLTDVTERTRVESHLRQSQKMEALGQLADGIARDFRGIGAGVVTALRQALEVLPENSRARLHLDDVAKKMDNAAALTHQLLDFSRNARHRENHGERGAAFDLNALVADLEPVLCRLVSPETCPELSLCEDPTPVLADRDHIRQVVVSFVIGARGLAGGSNKIIIVTEIDPKGPAPGLASASKGPFVSLSVRSTACPAEVLPWVGMATSQAILAQYGGTITAALEPHSSVSGAAVRYSLCLPLAAGARLTPPAIDTPSSATVLLVEEVTLIRELGRDMLERQGFHVLPAVNVAEAERIGVSGQTFDVLITDWAPDGSRNVALVQLLRQTRPDLCVLYIVGYADGSPDSTPTPAGSAVLQKPFSGDSLGRKIRQLLESSPTAGT
jgi:two-component system, cell cycle sensor histidine kinase and response regulator CckA